MGTRAQCIIHRNSNVLMVKQKYSHDGHEFWFMPGGAVEEGETPAEAAIRELKEECCVEGTIVRETSVMFYSEHDRARKYTKAHTFLVDIGTQVPEIGTDPERPNQQLLIDVKWLTLSEIPERDRAYLLAAGLLGIEEFNTEVKSWGDSISYPSQGNL